jgi:hypothetical protein
MCFCIHWMSVTWSCTQGIMPVTWRPCVLGAWVVGRAGCDAEVLPAANATPAIAIRAIATIRDSQLPCRQRFGAAILAIALTSTAYPPASTRALDGSMVLPWTGPPRESARSRQPGASGCRPMCSPRPIPVKERERMGTKGITQVQTRGSKGIRGFSPAASRRTLNPHVLGSSPGGPTEKNPIPGDPRGIGSSSRRESCR